MSKKELKSAEEMFKKDWSGDRGNLLPQITDGIKYVEAQQRDRKYFFPGMIMLGILVAFYVGYQDAMTPVSKGDLVMVLDYFNDWEEVSCNDAFLIVNMKCTGKGPVSAANFMKILEHFELGNEKTMDLARQIEARSFPVEASASGKHLTFKLKLTSSMASLEVAENRFIIHGDDLKVYHK